MNGGLVARVRKREGIRDLGGAFGRIPWILTRTLKKERGVKRAWESFMDIGQLKVWKFKNTRTFLITMLTYLLENRVLIAM